MKNNTSTSRYMETRFTNIGKVSPLKVDTDALKELLAGKYTTTNTIKGTEITFDVEVKTDEVFTISKNGTNFGSYGYTFNSSNNIVLDSAIERNVFTVTDGTNTYNCNIKPEVKIDDINNPSKITLDVNVALAGQPSTETVSFEASRATEPAPTYYFEFTLPTWNPVAEAPKFYYWGKDANNEFTSNSITWIADGQSNMTLKDGTTSTYYYEVDASIKLDGIIIAFEQSGQFKQSVDVTANLPTKEGKYEVISTYSDWSTGKFDGVYVQEIVEVEATYMKDAEDSYVVTIYYDLYDYLLGEKADYIPYIAGIESSIDIIWNDEYPEGYQYVIADAPEDYLGNFVSALTSVYGYTKVSDTVYVNSEIGLQIELKEDSGYQQFYFSLI